MKHYIGHQSALEYWRRHHKLPESSADRRCRVALPGNPSKIEISSFAEFEIPVHIMIGDRCARQSSRIVKQHLCSGKTPIGCFMNIGDGLMVSSPEYCFHQMAAQLTLAKLIELGYELCGVYSLPLENDPDVPARGFYNRPPLTSVKKLRCFHESLPSASGCKKAKRALRYILDGSASPMETILAIFLTLPYMLGGFGFDLPDLNKRITLTKAVRREFNVDFLVCDMYWPNERIAVEYDSDQQHTGSDRIASDSKRRNVLFSSGIKVISVTKQQLYSSVELERVARTIAKQMNKRLFSKKSKFYAMHRELKKQLL